MTNPFARRSASVSGPATDLEPVTPDDAADLPRVAIGLYVETGGALALRTVAGDGRTRVVVVGDRSILPVAVTRVLAAGTTAAGVFAFTVG